MKSMVRLSTALGVLALVACAGLRHAPHPDQSDTVVIHDVTVVDVVSGAARPHTTVTVVGSRITDVAPAGGASAPAGASVVDGSGRYLIPGLWDMHSHALWSREAVQSFLPLYVANGVTGIRDMGGRLPVLASVRDSMKRSDPPWPRVVAAGEILDGPQPIQRDISIPVSDSVSAVAAVDSLARAGVDFIKVYTLLPRDAYFAAVAEARRVHLPIAGHVPADVSVAEAARAGQSSFEHLRDELDLLCSPGDADTCRKLAEVLRVHRTWQVPTLTVLHGKAFFDDDALVADPRLRYMPPDLRREWMAERDDKIRRGSDYLALRRKRYEDAVWLTGLLFREQVPLLAGTDAGNAFCYPGFSLHDELELLVDAGLAPIEALRAATLSPADYLGERGSMGKIAVGHVADMVLLRANPLETIGATREIDAVVLRGRVLDRRRLDDLLDAVAADAHR